MAQLDPFTQAPVDFTAAESNHESPSRQLDGEDSDSSDPYSAMAAQPEPDSRTANKASADSQSASQREQRPLTTQQERSSAKPAVETTPADVRKQASTQEKQFRKGQQKTSGSQHASHVAQAAASRVRMRARCYPESKDRNTAELGSPEAPKIPSADTPDKGISKTVLRNKAFADAATGYLRMMIGSREVVVEPGEPGPSKQGNTPSKQAKRALPISLLPGYLWEPGPSGGQAVQREGLLSLADLVYSKSMATRKAQEKPVEAAQPRQSAPSLLVGRMKAAMPSVAREGDEDASASAAAPGRPKGSNQAAHNMQENQDPKRAEQQISSQTIALPKGATGKANAQGKSSIIPSPSSEDRPDGAADKGWKLLENAVAEQVKKAFLEAAQGYGPLHQPSSEAESMSEDSDDADSDIRSEKAASSSSEEEEYVSGEEASSQGAEGGQMTLEQSKHPDRVVEEWLPFETARSQEEPSAPDVDHTSEHETGIATRLRSHTSQQGSRPHEPGRSMLPKKHSLSGSQSSAPPAKRVTRSAAAAARQAEHEQQASKSRREDEELLLSRVPDTAQSGEEGNEDLMIEQHLSAEGWAGATILGARQSEEGVLMHISWQDGFAGWFETSALKQHQHSLLKIVNFYESKIARKVKPPEPDSDSDDESSGDSSDSDDQAECSSNTSGNTEEDSGSESEEEDKSRKGQKPSSLTLQGQRYHWVSNELAAFLGGVRFAAPKQISSHFWRYVQEHNLCIKGNKKQRNVTVCDDMLRRLTGQERFASISHYAHLKKHVLEAVEPKDLEDSRES